MTDPTAPINLEQTPLSPADYLRLIHTYITSTVSDGGLGIVSGSKEWDRIESVMALHDHSFNDEWIRLWTTRQLGFVPLDGIKDQVRHDTRTTYLTHRACSWVSTLRCISHS